ncbi:DUF1107 domain-containing protein [Vibrio sp.]|nr:DUF1107 domain-containing protein [Vibrio sp.]
MRLFKLYTPGMIAKHISRFFKGKISIIGFGIFEFDNGKLLIPEQPDAKQYKAVREVNGEVRRLRCAYN